MNAAWRLDARKYVLHWRSRSAQLTRQESRLTRIVAAAHGHVVTRDVLLHMMMSLNIEPKTLDVFVCKVRRKCRTARMPVPIDTVRSTGFCWCDEPCEIDDDPVLMIPPDSVRSFKRLLSTHPNSELADEVRYAVFGV